MENMVAFYFKAYPYEKFDASSLNLNSIQNPNDLH